MSISRFPSALFLAAVSIIAARTVCSQSALGGRQDLQRARILRTATLPPGMDGRHLTATLVAVHYGAGEASPPHTHSCPVVVYILQGSVRSKVEGQPEAIYKPGDSFYEPPGGLHLISANANRSAPARFLAFFVCDHDAPLSSDAPNSPSGAKP